MLVFLKERGSLSLRPLVQTQSLFTKKKKTQQEETLQDQLEKWGVHFMSDLNTGN